MVSALVLPVELAASGEPQTIPGLPGRWEPGVAYLPEAVGLTLAQAKELIADHGYPIQVVSVDDIEANATFMRAPGSHAPSGNARAAMPNLAEPPVVTNDQGVPVVQTPIPPAHDNPPWVEASIRDATALARGETPLRDDSMTDAFPGVPLPETPDVGLSTRPEDIVDPGYEEWRKDELVAEAERRELDTSGTKADLAERLRAHDAEPGIAVGPEEEEVS